MRRFLAAFAVLSLWYARPAEACGGFFCGSQQIDQSAEHIAFGVMRDASGNTTVEAHVQISFSGDARQFAWVVPVHTRPVLDIGTDAIFTYLDNATRPSFQLDYQGGTCGQFAYAAENSRGADAGTVGGGVQVVLRSIRRASPTPSRRSSSHRFGTPGPCSIKGATRRGSTPPCRPSI